MRVDDGATNAPLLCIVGGEMPRRRREPGDAAAGALFGERLNSLFATRPDPATGQPYSLRDVSAATAGVVSRAYLSTLRRGGVAMPGLHIIEALARFFDVPTGYFLGHDLGDAPQARTRAGDDEGELDEEAVLRLALADPLVREVALKVKDFGPEEWKLMIGMVESQMALRRLAEERARTVGATPPLDPSPPPSSPPPRDISTARRRTKKRDDASTPRTGGNPTEQE
jgi:transcriptional regulator with XRE-family HTH domain